MMLSRLLTHLDGAIARADSPLHAACLRAERAGHLARQGQNARAQAELVTLQHDLAWQPSDKLRTWALIAEGIIAHSQNLGCAAAHQAFDAAYDMAQRPAAQSMRPMAAAWRACMAHCDGEHELAARMLHVAFVNALPNDHATRMRSALVAADAYNQGARPVMAARWYEVSRRHAVAYGDEAHISGMLFNQASWHELWLRMQCLFGDALSAEARSQVVTSVDSTAHFDQGLGLSSVPSLLPVMRAQAMTSIGAYAEALPLFELHLDQALVQGMRYQDAGLHADRAWCEVKLHQPERARVSVALAEAALAREDASPEELAMAHERVSHVHQHLVDAASAAKQAHHAQQAQYHLARFRAIQAEGVAWLDKYLADIAPAVGAGHGLTSQVA
jgi:hypothetical protein